MENGHKCIAILVGITRVYYTVGPYLEASGIPDQSGRYDFLKSNFSSKWISSYLQLKYDTASNYNKQHFNERYTDINDQGLRS